MTSSSSPSTRRRDRSLKPDLYERAGVLEYWIVDPDAETIEVYRAGPSGFAEPVTLSGDDTLASPLLPGLSLAAGALFPG